jgi:hypothetical protein
MGLFHPTDFLSRELHDAQPVRRVPATNPRPRTRSSGERSSYALTRSGCKLGAWWGTLTPLLQRRDVERVSA